MQHEKTWTITQIRENAENEVRAGLTHEQALAAIRRAMSGETGSLLAPAETPVHELSLAA